ncbi:DUF4292 domain-containing protein [Myroides sp. WP-1]|uniref:DUF4292 domain-containing protein n=1 Tax=Myroides sp. WP-1 TaxID=2759944 RepID=UPI0015F7F779|nr:DUF4292 domain-containing protein [Myroides sp. WP-1]MBB1139484.1 DUF4292 domain-containing protein [Myroides sp. WP-1]
MKKIAFILLAGLLFMGCKKGNEGFLLRESDAKKSKTALVILNDHAKNAQQFKTVTLQGTAQYKDEFENRKVGIEVLIEKDTQIQMNIRYADILIFKALITPDNLQYFNKLNETAFQGGFDILTQFIGTDINFNRLQNLLLGQVLDSQEDKEFIATIEDGLHKVSSTQQEELQSTYFFEDENSLLKKESIAERDSNRKVTISYPGYQKINHFIVPTALNIQAEEGEKNLNLDIRYQKITFNEDLHFNYSVPKRYKMINL